MRPMVNCEYLEGAAMLHHGVEDFRHQTGIDQVALGLDDFADVVVDAHEGPRF